MQQITLSLDSDLAAKLKQLTTLFGSEDILFRNFVDFYRNKIRQSISAIQVDLEEFEQKHGRTSKVFYAAYENGKSDDSEDSMIWAGLYERKLEQERRLKLLK